MQVQRTVFANAEMEIRPPAVMEQNPSPSIQNPNPATDWIIGIKSKRPISSGPKSDPIMTWKPEMSTLCLNSDFLEK